MRRILVVALVLSVAVIGSLAARVSPALADQTSKPAQSTRSPSDALDHFTGSKVVRYAAVKPDSRYRTIHGDRIADGGCHFKLIGRMDASLRRGVRYTEVAYNPDTCESLLGVSRATNPEHDNKTNPGQVKRFHEAKHKRNTPARNAREKSDQICDNPGRDNVNFYAGDACIHSWYEDPAALHVNDLTNEMQWNTTADDSCIDVNYSWGSYSGSYLAATGWALDSTQFNNVGDCGYVKSESYTTFRNDPFCGDFGPVYTDYAPQSITGYPDLTYDWVATWNVRGAPCGGLLSFHTELFSYP